MMLTRGVSANGGGQASDPEASAHFPRSQLAFEFVPFLLRGRGSAATVRASGGLQSSTESAHSGHVVAFANLVFDGG